jgi:hypothetical protein
MSKEARRAARRLRHERWREGWYERSARRLNSAQPRSPRLTFFPSVKENRKAKPSLICSTFNGSFARMRDFEESSLPGPGAAGYHRPIIQKVRPDVLLINEFDYDEDGVSLKLFLSNYLGVAHEGSKCSVG